VGFLRAAINEVGLASVVPGGWKLRHYPLAGIFFLGALYGFVRPVTTFFALASVLGLILIVYGALFRGCSQLVSAFSVRHTGHEATTALNDTSPGPR
jgi:uncharacterized membrane protein HdeD (DUF308 family)